MKRQVLDFNTARRRDSPLKRQKIHHTFEKGSVTPGNRARVALVGGRAHQEHRCRQEQERKPQAQDREDATDAVSRRRGRHNCGGDSHRTVSG